MHKLIYIAIGAILTTATGVGFWMVNERQVARDRAELRADACGQLVDMRALPKSGYSSCLRDIDAYNFGVEAAVRLILPNLKFRTNALVDTMNNEAADLDRSQFKRIDFATFSQNFDPFYVDDPAYNPNTEIDKTVTEATQISTALEDDVGNPSLWISSQDTAEDAQLIAIDASLAETFNATVGPACRHAQHITGGCKGSVFISIPPGDASVAARVVGIQLEPITDAQIESTALFSLLIKTDFEGVMDGPDLIDLKFRKFLAVGVDPSAAME